VILDPEFGFREEAWLSDVQFALLRLTPASLIFLEQAVSSVSPSDVIQGPAKEEPNVQALHESIVHATASSHSCHALLPHFIL
jgi:hypothetical protein